MKKFTGILLAVLLIFTAVSCSFFMEEKNNNTESLVSFSLSGKSSKDDTYYISEYITYGESTVQYGTWTDMAWNIWYYTTDTEASAFAFTTPSEVGNTIANDPNHGGWIKYDKPFRVTKGVTVWAYCENTLTSATNHNVVDDMFKGIAHEKISKTKTYITVVPELDEKVAFKENTTGTVLIDTLTYIMSKDQATVTSGSDISKLKVVVSMGDTSCTDTKALVTDTNHPYGYTTFSNIKLEGVKVSEGPTSPSSIKVEFYGYKESGTEPELLDSYNVYELSEANTEKVVDIYVLNSLETDLKSITVENKTIILGIVYINVTETDMFPEKYNTNPSNAFNIKAEAPGATVALVKVGTPSDISLVYAINNAEYKDYTIGQVVTLTDIGDKVYFKAKTSNTDFSLYSEFNWDNFYHFIFTDDVSCSGNINYLLDANGIVDKIPAYCFKNLFAYYTEGSDVDINEHLKDASGLELPATNLSVGCYQYMFDRCTNLQGAPQLLPAMELAGHCYKGMFKRCSALTTAPKLPATDLGTNNEWVYGEMFSGCSNLKTAPELPATTVCNSCYNEMFVGCNKLQSITVHFTSWKVYSDLITNNWVSGVSASGTFKCPTTLDTETKGASNIPTGWTVVTF